MALSDHKSGKITSQKALSELNGVLILTLSIDKSSIINPMNPLAQPLDVPTSTEYDYLLVPRL
jgi:hypothetical protein